MDSRTVPIAVVARETGLSKDLLRKWELRYGFPLPVRSPAGSRVYPLPQIESLREIKRLMDGGSRASDAIRDCLKDAVAGKPIALPSRRPEPDESVALCLAALRAQDAPGLYALLERSLASLGVSGFITRTAAPLSVAVGDAWMHGTLRVHQEHLFSVTLAALLADTCRRLEAPSGGLRVLFTTLPGESHTLGLDMARVLLAAAGACCVSLGAQTPLAEIARAVVAHQAHVVVLSFSAAYPVRLLAPALSELRALLAEDVPIWIGGAGTLRDSPLPAGVRAFVDIGETPVALRELQHSCNSLARPSGGG